MNHKTSRDRIDGPHRTSFATLALLLLSTISACALSDLVVVGSLTVTPNPVTAGNLVTVGISIKNQGASSAAATTTRLQIKNAALTVTIVDGDATTPSIPAGQTIAQNYQVTIPPGTTPGTYNAYVVLDRYGTGGQGGNTANDFGSSGPFTINGVTETISIPGGISGQPSPVQNSSYTYTVGASTSSLGHTVEYSFDWGDGTSSAYSTSTSALHAWSSTGQKYIFVTARCQTHTGVSQNNSPGNYVTVQPLAETLSVPTGLTGEPNPIQNTSYSYTVGASSSSLGHTVEYSFNWGDGTSSSFSTSRSASHSWSTTGQKTITVTSHCQTHTGVTVNNSPGNSVTVQAAETVSTPGAVTGQPSPVQNLTYSYGLASTSLSSLGHTVEYSFNWGDGTASTFSTSTSASHTWATTGQKFITVTARCQTHTTVTANNAAGNYYVVVQSAPPSSQLVSVSGVPATISVGQPFTVTIAAQNNGGLGGLYSAINASVVYSDGTDDLTVNGATASWADNGGIYNFAPGAAIRDNSCNQISAIDHLVEAQDNNWTSGEQHSMSFTVTPNRAGTLYVRARTTLHNGDSGCIYVNDISASGGTVSTDQQGWGVKQYSVIVGSPCIYGLSTPNASYSSSPGSGSFNITAGAGCNWTANSTVTWLHTSSSGSGGGTINYTVDVNQYANSRSGTITVGGQTFTVNQSGAASPVSAALSTLTVTPSSTSADGQSSITVTVTLRNANNTPVAGKTVRIYSSAALSISQPLSATDASGHAIATIRATTPVRTTIWALDTTDSVLVQQQPTIEFTSASVIPNPDLSDAISLSYDNTSQALTVIPNVAVGAANYGDNFRSNMSGDEAALVFDVLLGAFGIVESAKDSLEFARLLALPGVEEIGAGALIKDQPLLTYLLDTELVHNEVTSRVLKSTLLQVAKAGGQKILETFDEYLLAENLKLMAKDPHGLSSRAQDNAKNASAFRQILADDKQKLLTQGIAPLSAPQQTAWANDLELRRRVGLTYSTILSQQRDLLGELFSARENAEEVDREVLFVKLAVEAGATVFLDGPGALITGTAFTIDSIQNDMAKLTTDQSGYESAFSVLGGCIQYENQALMNLKSAYIAIAQGRAADPVTGTIGDMSDIQEGYETWGPLHLQRRFVVTKCSSFLRVRNTTSSAATFEVIVTFSHPGSAYGVSVPYFSDSRIGIARIPALSEVQIPITYYDGNHGGKPDSSMLMYVYVLGNNHSGTFHVGTFSHTWTPVNTTSGLVTSRVKSSLDAGEVLPEIENPVATYVTQDPGAQTYQTRIFVQNPFSEAYTAIVTQPLSSGIEIVATDGTVTGSSIVWTNTIAGGGRIRDSFTFSLSVLPGALTNLPVPTVTFVDPTNNPSGSLASALSMFNGLSPIQISGFVPVGLSGVAVSMPITVTNLSTLNQIGSLDVVLKDITGSTVASFSNAFSLNGFASTNLSVILPGDLGVGSYALVAYVRINGGTMQGLSGVYIVRPVPVMLKFGSTPALTTDGLSLKLQGPLGSNYLIEFSTNLITWQPVLYFAITNSPFYFSEPGATNAANGFYRAVLP